MNTYGPYSPARRAGDLLFISGQVGIHPDDATCSTDIAEQADQALSNLQATVRAEGAELRDVVRTTVYLTDMKNFAAMNSVYETYFPSQGPARSTVGVRDLPHLAPTPLLIEIDAVVYKRGA